MRGELLHKRKLTVIFTQDTRVRKNNKYFILSMQYCTYCVGRNFVSRIFRRFLACSPINKQTGKMVNPAEKKVINFAPGPAKLPQEVMQNIE